MYRVKKLAFVFACLVFLTTALCQTASAIELSPQASLYLSNYGARLYQGSSSGTISVEFTVSATEDSDLVGVSNISIYKEDGTFVTSVRGSVGNRFLDTDTKTHIGYYTYRGEVNTVYYMVLTMYAERDGGSDYASAVSASKKQASGPSRIDAEHSGSIAPPHAALPTSL